MFFLRMDILQMKIFRMSVSSVTIFIHSGQQRKIRVSRTSRAGRRRRGGVRRMMPSPKRIRFWQYKKPAGLLTIIAAGGAQRNPWYADVIFCPTLKGSNNRSVIYYRGILFNPCGVVIVCLLLPRVTVALLPTPAAIIIMTPSGSEEKNGE